MRFREFIRNTSDETLVRVYLLDLREAFDRPYIDATLPEDYIANKTKETQNLKVCFWGIEKLENDAKPVLWVAVKEKNLE